MTSTPFLFRFRYAIHTIIFVLGFFAPWNYWLHLDHGKTVWEYLAIVFFQHGWLRFEAATVALLLVAIAFAAVGAWLRTWGSAYMGMGVVQSSAMHSGGSGSQTASPMVADGPYRHVRNPLYLGTFLHTVGLTLIMPPSGAVFAIVAIGVVQWLLIFAEEPFLRAKLGQAYRDYAARVPRLLPAAPARVPAGSAQPQWRQAMLCELYFIAVPVGFAVFGWRYDAMLLVRCVVVAFGLQLVARAFVSKPAAAAS